MIRGKYERPLIRIVRRHFNDKGYSTKAHAKLNIAWAELISDVDILAKRNNEIIAVEVKSRNDVFNRAFQQLDKIAPFVDRAYIATDDIRKAKLASIRDSHVGILYIDSSKMKVTRKKAAQRITSPPSGEFISHMRRCCLQDLAREYGVATRQSKSYIALDLTRIAKPSELRKRLKEIVARGTCPHLSQDKHL